jgi:N-acetylmuramoyl-L-alanine amidase-like protein
MPLTWLPGAQVVDLSGSRGNGPFSRFLGVALHVNVDENGTSDSFWRSNPGQVTPNFQVYKDGSVHQMLPFDWQPWCQIDGNFNYAAIETAGMPTEPLTPQQCAAIAKILQVYHTQMGMPLTVADSPGQRGFITHQAGGPAWGGHACPGPVRAAQRQSILNLANTPTPTGDDHMSQADVDALTKHIDQRFDDLSAGLVRRLDNVIKPLLDKIDAAVEPQTGAVK